MIKRFMRNRKCSDTEERILSIALFLLIILAVGGLIYEIYSIVYPKTLDYIERPATVVSVQPYSDSGVLVPIKSGNVTLYQEIGEDSGVKVTYEDEDGKRFTEKFSGGTDLVIGDEVIISIGYKNGEEADYIKFVRLAN